MKPLMMIGLIVIGLGIAGLVVEHFSYTTEKKVIDLGPLKATVDETHNVNIPNIASIVIIVGGVLLMGLGLKRA